MCYHWLHCDDVTGCRSCVTDCCRHMYTSFPLVMLCRTIGSSIGSSVAVTAVSVITDHFGGPGRAVGQLRVSL